MSELIKFDNITKEYFGRVALKDVSFSVSQGTIHALLGPNGAGKSTAMKIMAGLLRPTSGNVTRFSKQNRTVGYLPENPPLYNQMTVFDYLYFVGRINDISGIALKQEIESVLSNCSLTDVAHRIIGTLSKGYRQRVGIAQALIGRPEVIILDEPTVGLDPENIIKIRDVIKSLKGKHTILLSTHLLHEVDLLCSHATFLFQGEVLKSGEICAISRDLLKGEKIILELEEWNSDMERYFKERFPSDLSVKKEKNFQISMILNNRDDSRTDVAKFLHQQSWIPLSLKEEEPTTTEIFKNLLQRERQDG